MNSKNNKHFFCRMKELISVAKSDRFQALVKDVDTKNSPFLVKLETMLLRHKIIFWIYIHGLKKLLS